MDTKLVDKNNYEATVDQDFQLTKHFSQLKIPLWLAAFPIVGNIVYSALYRSWIFVYYNKEKARRIHRRCVLRTSGVWVISLLLLLLFNAFYWVGVLTSDISGDFVIPLYLSVVVLWGFINLLYQPINLRLEPRRMMNDFGYNGHEWRSLLPQTYFGDYSLESCIKAFSGNLSGISSFCLFNDSNDLKDAWLKDSVRPSVYSIARINILCREFGVIPPSQQFENLMLSWNPIYSRLASTTHLKYLKSSGIGMVGVLFLSFALFGKEDNAFFRSIRTFGIVFAAIFWALNIVMWSAYFIIYLGILFAFSWIFQPIVIGVANNAIAWTLLIAVLLPVLVDLIYVHLLGLIMSACISERIRRKNVLQEL